MATANEEDQTTSMTIQLLKLLVKFFRTDMTKEELRQEYTNLLESW